MSATLNYMKKELYDIHYDFETKDADWLKEFILFNSKERMNIKEPSKRYYIMRMINTAQEYLDMIELT